MGSASSSKKFGSGCALLCGSVLIAGVGLVGPAHAQKASSPVRFDIGTGVFTGRGAGVRDARAGAAAVAQLTGNVWTRGNQSLLLAANLSTYSTLDSGDDCTVPVGNPGGACLADFPGATGVSALVGFEHRFVDGISVRLLAGPSLLAGYKAKFGVETAGALSRLDFTVPAHARLAFVMWGQAGIMQLETGPSGKPFFFGLGLRVQ